MGRTEKRELFNERPVYTLTEISKSLQSIIAKTYKQPYYIKAEIIKLNYYPRSGHCYPELVDKEDGKIKTQMRAIIWATQFNIINDAFKRITGEPLKEGIAILCLASIEYSPQYGLALHIQHVEPTFTLGEMAKNKIAVIERLKKEGIFIANKKLKLPLVPKRIAVISIETSKGYSDFMITLNQNNWNYKFECQLFPAILQGEKAIFTISQQLEIIKSQLTLFDCVVIIRGGGGDAGLSCYDDYQLAKNIATFPLPVLSGIGHSTNETVAEMVAYDNKITPTEVAYFLIQQFHNFAIQIEDFQNILLKKTNDRIKNDFQFLDHTSRLVKLFLKQIIEKQHDQLKSFEKQLKLLHPDNILKRGFSITYFNGKPVTDGKELADDDIIITKYYKGKTKSIIKKST